MKRQIRSVPEEIWQLSYELGDRRKYLLNGPDPDSLLEKIIFDVSDAVRACNINLVWQPSCESPGKWRLVADFPVTGEIFDQFFNGRSGYRAQYYLSPEEGILFNRDLVVSLAPFIRAAYSQKPLDISFSVVERSLMGAHSKLWIYDEKNLIDASPAELLSPVRWVKNGASRGRRAPLPTHPRLDLKGTFIDPDGPEIFIDECKLDRAWDLHRKGYT